MFPEIATFLWEGSMIVALVNQKSGEKKNIKVGWSWTCFFFSSWLGVPLFLRRLNVWGAFMCALWFAHVAAVILLSNDSETMMAEGIGFNLLLLGISIWFGLKANRMAFVQYLESGWEPLDRNAPEYMMAKCTWKLEEVSSQTRVEEAIIR
jgi:hypothetical protein